MPENPDYLDIAAMARLFGVSRDSIERHRASLPAGFRIGGKTIWTRAEILEHVRANTKPVPRPLLVIADKELLAEKASLIHELALREDALAQVEAENDELRHKIGALEAALKNFEVPQ